METKTPHIDKLLKRTDTALGVAGTAAKTVAAGSLLAYLSLILEKPLYKLLLLFAKLFGVVKTNDDNTPDKEADNKQLLLGFLPEGKFPVARIGNVAPHISDYYGVDYHSALDLIKKDGIKPTAADEFLGNVAWYIKYFDAEYYYTTNPTMIDQISRYCPYLVEKSRDEIREMFLKLLQKDGTKCKKCGHLFYNWGTVSTSVCYCCGEVLPGERNSQMTAKEQRQFSELVNDVYKRQLIETIDALKQEYTDEWLYKNGWKNITGIH